MARHEDERPTLSQKMLQQLEKLALPIEELKKRIQQELNKQHKEKGKQSSPKRRKRKGKN